MQIRLTGYSKSLVDVKSPCDGLAMDQQPVQDVLTHMLELDLVQLIQMMDDWRLFPTTNIFPLHTV